MMPQLERPSCRKTAMDFAVAQSILLLDVIFRDFCGGK
jgi:hypothetical protein